MEIRDWIMIISSVIVVTGWFVSGYLNRRHEVAKKRMEYRLTTLHSFLPVFFSMQKYKDPFSEDPELMDKIENSRLNFQLYGRKDEIDKFEDIVKTLESRKVEELTSVMNIFISLIRNRIRKEIGLENT